MSPTTGMVVTAFLLMAVVGEGLAYSGRVLLVSMDGFRWDYIHKVPGLTHFPAMAASGCTVDYLNNTFLTKTFPCHYSIITGLYDESHGIVANSMYDRTRNATFGLASTESFWWNGGEPIWVTAEKQKPNSSAVCFWPGSGAEIRGYRPSIYKAYNQSMPFKDRVDLVMKWFVEDKKEFVALYFHEPDATGHAFGPNSSQVAQKVQEMDGILGYILSSLDKNNLTDTVNLIVTSDHGMTDVNMQNKLMDLWVYVNRSLVEVVPDSGPVTAILPRPGQEAAVFAQARKIPHATAYLKDDIPDMFHYKNNDRVMPIIVMSDEGWILSAKMQEELAANLKGNHGYSNQLQTMKPIFFARGPDFRKNVKVITISSLDIYPLMCRLLNINAAPHNGSLDNTVQFLVSSSASHVFIQFSWVFFSLLLAALFVY